MQISAVHLVGLLGTPKVDEENDDLQHGNVVDIHARETHARRWSVVEPVPARCVELFEIVWFGPGQSEPDIVEQEDHLHGAVRDHDGQYHHVQLPCPRGAGLVATVASAQQILTRTLINLPVSYPVKNFWGERIRHLTHNHQGYFETHLRSMPPPLQTGGMAERKRPGRSSQSQRQPGSQ